MGDLTEATKPVTSTVEPGSPAQTGGGDKGPKPVEERLAELEAQAKENKTALSERDKRIQELSESERYWADRYRSAAEGAGAEEEDDEGGQEDNVIDDSADKTVDAFSTKGISALVERGLLTKKQAIEMIQKEARKVAESVVTTESKKLRTDAELVQKYPDLQNQESDLFKRTGVIFREMVAEEPSLKSTPQALMLAARTAKAELAAESNAITSTNDQKEKDRQARIRAQAGDGGGHNFQDQDNGELSAMQKRIIERFNREGGIQVTEEAYKKRAEAGVRMSTRAAIQANAPPPASKGADTEAWR